MALPFELWMLWRAANERGRAPVFQGTSSGCGRQVPLVGYTLLETRLGFHTTSGPLHRSHSTTQLLHLHCCRQLAPES